MNVKVSKYIGPCFGVSNILSKTKEVLSTFSNTRIFIFGSLVHNKETIKEISLDLHNSNYENNIMTEYEKKFRSMNNRIYYVKVVKIL